MSETLIQTRRVPTAHFQRLLDGGVHPLLARLYAARGVRDAAELDYSLNALLPPAALKGADKAATLLADAIAAQARIMIVADYDCDGATACAVAVRALRAMGARHVDYLVPDRFRYGYGLSPAIVDLAAPWQPDILITVDNGIASFDGVARARALGIRTLITDHHLPADALPAADIIVNPNQPGCDFPSKAIAGVGVIFYVMLALRSELRQRGHFCQRTQPNLSQLLDLVALGTVADVVTLDHNNRILVSQGLARIRAGHMQAGLAALFAIAGRDPHRASTFDLGFALGPRLNAAGRLDDMRPGIACLLSDDAASAANLAQELNQLNQTRRSIEAEMQQHALEQLADFDPGQNSAISLFAPDWHQGVTGIVAGRMKEKFHRPTFAFARTEDGLLKGSGRSINGIHLRDALDLISKRHPDLLRTFGGHAMAAGLTLTEKNYASFRSVFEDTISELIDPAALVQQIDTDGSLEATWHSLPTARLIEQHVWGQGFPAPLFNNEFELVRQRLLKDRHLKLELRHQQQNYEAIYFNHAQSAPARLHAAYRLDVNEFRGISRLQLLIQHLQAAPGQA